MCIFCRFRIQSSNRFMIPDRKNNARPSGGTIRPGIWVPIRSVYWVPIRPLKPLIWAARTTPIRSLLRKKSIFWSSRPGPRVFWSRVGPARRNQAEFWNMFKQCLGPGRLELKTFPGWPARAPNSLGLKILLGSEDNLWNFQIQNFASISFSMNSQNYFNKL